MAKNSIKCIINSVKFEKMCQNRSDILEVGDGEGRIEEQVEFIKIFSVFVFFFTLTAMFIIFIVVISAHICQNLPNLSMHSLLFAS